MPVTLATALAMIAFAANSVLARLALEAGAAEPMAYTGVRLASGALTLAAFVVWRDPGSSGAGRVLRAGSWSGAAGLFGYAIAFSIAYVALGAGTGALILFGAVQAGMLGWAILKGDRPGLLEWAGLALALGGLAYLVAPGLAAPDPASAALMVAAGLCWAAYSLIGRGSRQPLADTAGNFLRCLPVALVLTAFGLASRAPTSAGMVYAVLSGIVASGIGYAIWYSALPALTRARAAFVQLTVPAIAAAGGVLLIGEPLTIRLVTASILILGGVALALAAGERRRRTG